MIASRKRKRFWNQDLRLPTENNTSRDLVLARDVPSGTSGHALGTGREGANRRDVIRAGAKLAFVAPVISSFFAADALAAGSNHSCYPAGHACPGAEPCCTGLTCNGGVCDACVDSGGLCFADSDCCSGKCDLNICQ